MVVPGGVRVAFPCSYIVAVVIAALAPPGPTAAAAHRKGRLCTLVRPELAIAFPLVPLLLTLSSSPLSSPLLASSAPRLVRVRAGRQKGKPARGLLGATAFPGRPKRANP